MKDWQRLDPRMLLIYPVREFVRFLPALIALFIAGSATNGGRDWWQIIGIAVPVALGVLRYFTTGYRITTGRIELRRGLLNRHVLSTPLDRVRTVDITAPPVHRLLGLTSVRIGTGTTSGGDEDRIDLDGLPVEQARRLRADLLHLGGEHTTPEVESAEAVLVFDPSWVRFAPLTSTGLVITAGVLGVAAQVLNTFNGFERLHPERFADDAAGWSVWIAIPVAVIGLAVVVSGLSIGGYVVNNWGFRLSHTGSIRGGAWHLTRGLLTTRETTLDDERVRGVSVGEPLGLRLAGGGRAWAIVTGLEQNTSGSALLVPPAPRAVVHRAAGEVLHTPDPLEAPLLAHGPRARTRRYTRAVGPAVLVLVVAAILVPLADLPLWAPAVAALGLPVAVALAADRARALGHALVAGHVVVRSGSLNRRRDALETDGVIGWNLRSTWFQRRAGLATLVATTSGGRQAVTALDVPEPMATGLAHSADPDLIAQFLVESPAETATWA
ncbi:PH domain-containing protein [Nocardioides sp. SR21]|uniref:PH domain-containing protein n=1 Tax=Nocardioides sp. SR21 TaxID=2919501 RepID=UPI001FAA8E9F|nr:PH domain-containing protein [Nocardioides sp. SR21]